jgi:flagellar basal-body rod protein FlgB
MTLDLFGNLAPLERSLDFHLARHSVLATNLANAETPGFVPQDLVFSAALDQQTDLARTDKEHLATSGLPAGTSVQEDGQQAGVDGNGVRLEAVMAQITANRLRYETGIELTQRRLALLRYAATDGAG